MLSLAIISCTKEKDNDLKNEPINYSFTPSQDSLEWTFGYNTFDMEVGGVTRNFVIHVPNSYSHSNDSIPLLCMLHGSSGDGDRFYNISGWVKKSNEEGFIAIFPTAYSYPIADKSGKLSTKWNDAAAINDVESGTVLQDDVAFMQWLVDQVQKTFYINKNRRYICGFSNGGGFVRDRVMQEIPTLFAAGATGGGFGIPEAAQVVGDHYMPMFCILGSKDGKIIEASGLNAEIPIEGETFMAQPRFRQYLDAMLNTLKLDSTYTESQNPPAYNILTFDKQLSNQKNEYNLMIVNELEHNFPNGNNNKHNVSGPDILWPWFKRWSF